MEDRDGRLDRSSDVAVLAGRAAVNQSTSDSSSSIGGYLQLLLPYWWVVAACAVSGTAVAAALTSQLEPVYQATCTLEFNPNPPQPLGSEVEDVTGPRNNFWMSREFYGTQRRIIESRSVAEEVVQEKRHYFQGIEVEDAARQLQSQLTVDAERNTRLVMIQVRDADPERAADLSNAVAEAYAKRALADRLGSSGSALDWLNNQLQRTRGELEDSELALHDFKRENNVLSLSMEERQNQVASDIMQFSNALAEARTRRIELAARLQQLQSANDDDPMQVASSGLLENETIAELRQQLRTKLAEREAQAARGPGFGENHPTMIALNAEIESLQQLLRAELDTLISAAEGDLVEASAVEAGLRRAVEEAHQAGLELNLREIEYQRLNRERQSNEQLYGLLLQRSAETNLTKTLTEMLQVTHVNVVDRALPPSQPVSPNVPLNVGIGALAGLALGVLIALGLAMLDTRVKSAETLESLGLTVIGVLPEIEGAPSSGARDRQRRRRRRREGPPDEKTELVVHTRPRSAFAESARTIRTNLAFMGADEPLRSLVVTSPGPSEGKTTVAISLAIAFAQNGLRVLLVDSDLRRPRIHRVFGTGIRTGVTTILVGEDTLENAAHRTEVPGLDVLPCGPVPPNPAELLHSSRFDEFLQDALGRYDRVIFDSPPLGPVIDAAVVAPQVKGVLVVVKAKQTNRYAVAAAMRQLRDVRANVLGGIFNAVDLLAGRYYGNRGYYYQGYEAAPDLDDDDLDDSGGESREQRPVV